MKKIGSFVLCLMIVFSTNSADSVMDYLLSNESFEDIKSNPIPRCICPLGLSTENCRIEESVHIKPIIFTDPLWDDYSPTSSFMSMEDQICEEMGNIFGALRVWCRLIYSRKGNKVIPTRDGTFNYDGNQQEEPLDNVDIEPYDTPCSDHLCKSYEKCAYKGMGYRCRCKLFKFGKPCNDTKDCANESCKRNQTCPALEDCYKCDCNLFKLEQICEYAGFDLLLSGLVACFTITIILFIILGRRREVRPIIKLMLT